MRIFSFSETYGPFNCEATNNPDCDGMAWDCVLTKQENENLPEQTGPVAAQFILRNGVGILVCGACLKEIQDGG